jgi:hypothetical protein
MTLYTIEKHETNGLKTRIIIKGFKQSDALHKFLCSPDNYSNKWRESARGLKPGTYAYVAGALHNVKTLPPSMLCHI